MRQSIDLRQKIHLQYINSYQLLISINMYFKTDGVLSANTIYYMNHILNQHSLYIQQIAWLTKLNVITIDCKDLFKKNVSFESQIGT